MGIEEIKKEDLKPKEFIDNKVKEIYDIIQTGYAVNALSGGVDSSVVTILGHKALGDRLKSYFIDNGLMRENEPEQITTIFKDLGVDVYVIDAKGIFFNALKGLTDPEEKREAITQTFYKEVLADLIKEKNAKYLLHGTILTDVDETKAGIKRQHNIFEQIGIDPKKEFGYHIIEPLVQLRKDGVRAVAKELGLPSSVYDRPPFPGPALAARVIGEVTPEKIGLVRKATVIVENELKGFGAFQYFPILHEDKVTGIRENKRDFGCQIEVRCWNSTDARTATPTRLPYKILESIAGRITKEISGVVSVTYNITNKPPSTIEAI